MEEIREFDDTITWKRVAQSIKSIVKDLEKMEKFGLTIEATRTKYKVQGTRYAVIAKVQNNPRKKLIVKRIIRHR